MEAKRDERFRSPVTIGSTVHLVLLAQVFASLAGMIILGLLMMTFF